MKFNPFAFLALAASVVQASPFHILRRFENSTSSVAPGATSNWGNPTTVLPAVESSSYVSSLSAEETYTVTIIEYVTLTTGSSTIVTPTNTWTATYTTSQESQHEDSVTTSTITEYVTLTTGSSTIVTPTNTWTATYTPSQESQHEDSLTTSSQESQHHELVTTSTITSYITITNSDDASELSTETEAILETSQNTDACVPSTVTVTVTATPTPAPIVSTSLYVTSFPVQAEFESDDITTTITSFVQVTQTLLHTLTSESSSSSTIVPTYGTFYSNSTIPATATW